MKISAVINTRNEQSNISFCLETVKWCDEIVVVDMESDDRTVEIALDYTKKVFKHKRILAFDTARKYAVEQASGDWILIIDADELITSDLKQFIVQQMLDNSNDVFYLPRINYIMGEWITHSGWWPDYLPRFFRKGSILFTGEVHDFMHILPGARVRYLPSEKKLAIVHFAYMDSEHFITKLNHYTTIESNQMMASGRRFSFMRLLIAGFRGFQVRYLSHKGFLDGSRGFFLSVMMGFYGILTYIKLWEACQFKNESVVQAYQKLKDDIVDEHSR